ncbi:putative bifunctional diguanylate cyclase/phosphodiesterase [Aliamphritea spongicola]|uniref:putative bifunctional diguanylate cyclase/phosphodiesterase n=1 Tax=Aliamphritea spongicola TaxID=707589 RepID=UPI00196B4443|nr:GGDEF and EAL domain-containing protein [Aliamphritea spongicola]MBN3564230.1 EAL domain-containing protein [Aliamphritea spongicola]
MINRLTIRLFCIVSLITLLVMSSFVAVRYVANAELMESTSQERGLAVAKRVAASVKPTIWNIYNKSYNRTYTAEFADAILDAEMDSEFIQGIKVFGNFGHLYMGKIKRDNQQIERFNADNDELNWKQQPNRISYPVSLGAMTIGHVEVSYSDKEFAETLRSSLWVDITQVAIVSLLFVGSLYIVLRLALVSPMQSLQVAQHALDALDEAVFVVNKDGHVIDINPSYTTITHYKESEILHRPPAIYATDRAQLPIFQFAADTLKKKKSWSGQVVGQRKDGSTFPGWLNINIVEPVEGVLNDTNTTYVGVLTDIAEKQEAEQKLHHLAYFDTLTQIPNRYSFMLRLEADIHLASRQSSALALLFIDLDNFKWTNDSFGHEAGDLLLIEIANRLKARLRKSDTVYRIGGDEFTVIVSSYMDNDSLVQLAEDLVGTIGRTFYVDEHKIKPGASIGISTFPGDAANAHELIKRADSAMFQAKEQGRGQVCFFSSHLEQQRQRDQMIIEGLKEAIQEDELDLHYQPKVMLRPDGFEVIGAEALLRWHRDGEVVSTPDRFIPIAEQSNLICELGYWVIDKSCRQIAEWKEQSLGPLTIAVNLSPRQFKDSQLCDYLDSCLQKYQIQPGELELEITESAVIEDIQGSIKTLTRLQSMGISIAMDDFGTGYSSLGYLKQLPIEVLKIDRSFISTIPNPDDNDAIVKAIFSMANALGLEVVAEGIENQQQLEFLVANNCQVGQGYYFSQPLPVKQFKHWLTAQARPLLSKA